MKAIQKLGESEDGRPRSTSFARSNSGMSAEAKKECERELKRLAKMTPASRMHRLAYLS